MPSLTEIVRAHTRLDDADMACIGRLLADWQIVADLSFADLVLWLPDRDGAGFWAGAQMRPTTAPTAYTDDVVGSFVPLGRRPLVDAAYREGRLAREGDPEWRDTVPVRVECVPVRHAGRVVAVLARNTNLQGIRTPSKLELAYLDTAADLTTMIADGSFPDTAQRSDHADSPRVGDGFVRIDDEGRVVYASPNALSVYRRLGLVGDLSGADLARTTRDLVPAWQRLDLEALGGVLAGRQARDTEVGTDEVTLIVRSIPLVPRGQRLGAVILVRDVSDLRRRDRELVTKDATIREIHHRVKNNLQTVASLLRLQARRMPEPTARAALDEAVRRVGSIAIVHETLSHSGEGELIGFDEVVDRLTGMVADVTGAVGRVSMRRVGRFGDLPSATATTLAIVLSELVHNAFEHGFPAPGRGGVITVAATRRRDRLRVRVADDGAGLPAGFNPVATTSLGLTIVSTLVEGELHGDFRIGPAKSASGTVVVVDLPLG